ncbi:MAG: DUF2282 domain-containing protein [Polaromonas sp.]|jgi:uncharacterized membrane protein|uniref:BufA1 family periplasmic bufferin-type metallophore n=1 Tax=Polaromonas sp. TaxID=1869339 RepID=UPI002736E659|nr:DUF2282 domain-containing protein [Polaromonas sp.]MDP3795786.1 DUF2282 domain-containing protein [Polaromonas sp.]
MNQHAMIAAAAVSLLSSLLVATPVAAQSKEKCYGVALAGQNDCASFSGLHSCAGQTKANNDIADWKYVAKGTCAGMKGLSAAEAKAKIEMMKKDANKKS